VGDVQPFTDPAPARAADAARTVRPSTDIEELAADRAAGSPKRLPPVVAPPMLTGTR
jgi:hypothetical protein